MRIMKCLCRCVAIVLVFSFTATAVSAAPDLDVNTPNVQIDKVREAFNLAYSDGNAVGLAGLLAEDAVWMPPGEPAVIGRDAIQAVRGPVRHDSLGVHAQARRRSRFRRRGLAVERVRTR